MSIRFQQAAGITLGSDPTAGTGASKATLAFRIRFNWPPEAAQSALYVQSPIFQARVLTVDTTFDLLNVHTMWVPTSGAVGPTPALYAGVVNHVVAIYDAADASRQAIYVNGVKTLVTPAASVGFGTAATTLKIGMFTSSLTNPVDFDCEGVFWASDYAASDADIEALLYGADPTTFGGDSTQRGYWPMTGVEGSPVTTSDAGLANTFAPSFAPTLYLGTTTGTALTYGADMPYAPAVDPDGWNVCTSGGVVQFVSRIAATGAPATVVGDPTSAPVIVVNGGDPITLEAPFYTSQHAGIAYFTPGGVTIPAGAAVTVRTANGWLDTVAGEVAGVTDVPIPNRVGKPLYSDLPPAYKLGFNHAVDSGYWHYGYARANLASRLNVANATLRADGTIGADITNVLVFSTSFDNLRDDTGTPILYGKYALAFDSPSPTTNIAFSTLDTRLKAFVTELTEYRNEGDSNGAGQARVYDLQPPQWAVTLTAACSDADTTLTLDDVSSVVPATSSGAIAQRIQFGSEYVQIKTVNTTTKQITVVRGAYGTTAAAHDANTVGDMRSQLVNVPLVLQFTDSATHQPLYSNLVFYGPNDFDLPETPGPIVLDQTPNAFVKPSSFALEPFTKHGLQINRCMNNTSGGYDLIAQPEHRTVESDPWPVNNTKYSFAVSGASNVEATPESCPYVYFQFPIQGAEKYAATLGADVTTAPAAGTVETITVSDAGTAPVMSNLQLEFPSGEIVRVLSVAGDQVTVVRGSGSTTPTTQAAGPILVRWRVPMSSVDQLTSNGAAQVLMDCGSPHGLFYTSGAFPASNDLNPLARFNVTLTQDITSTDKTFTVSTDPTNAQYLCDGLYVKFDDEVIWLRRIDATGTVTLAGRNAVGGATRSATVAGSGAAAHANGTVGVASSGGVFCVGDDGTTFAWSREPSFKTPLFLADVDKLLISHGGFADTSQAYHVVGAQSWEPIASDGTQAFTTSGPADFNPFATAARITAASPGTDHWLNIPFFASDDLVDAIAREILPILPDGKHRILVEHCNELWNSGTFAYQSMAQLSRVCGYPDPENSAVARGAAVYNRVKAVFAEAGRSDEILWVLAWQQGAISKMIGQAVTLGVDSDLGVVSTAPYIKTKTDAFNTAAWNRATDEQALDLVRFDFECNQNANAGKLFKDGKARSDYEASSGRSIEFISYEGGPDSFMPYPPTNLAGGPLRNFDLNYNPNCYHFAYDIPYIIDRVGGCNGIVLYVYCQSPAENSGSSYDYASQWGILEWCGQQAGYGDGRDGTVDNRNFLAVPGKTGSKPLITNQALNVTSPRLQAAYDYSDAYVANLTPPDNPPPPTTGSLGSVLFLLGF